MFTWLKRLFSRKVELTIIRDGEHVEVMSRAEWSAKPGTDIIGRQGGQKRNRTHIYRRPFGYPIRLCDWTGPDEASIERIGEVQGIAGPADARSLVMALDWAEYTKGAVICKHCRDLVMGERGPLMGLLRGPA